MGVVVVGPSGAGKSTLWRMLRAALNKTGKVVSKRLTVLSCHCAKKIGTTFIWCKPLFSVLL